MTRNPSTTGALVAPLSPPLITNRSSRTTHCDDDFCPAAIRRSSAPSMLDILSQDADDPALPDQDKLVVADYWDK
jgi:hypothetical protein